MKAVPTSPGSTRTTSRATATHPKVEIGARLREGTRNKRSVWEVATQPFSEAHFATYPPALIEPCILAGCPKGGTVIDPFGGAGTTGLVADRLQRDAILIELNPEYAEIARKRRRMIRYVAGRCPSGQAPVAEEPVVIPDFFARPRITSAELRQLFEFGFAERLSIHRIQDEVARFYGLAATDIRMPDQKGARVRLISQARQMAMFMAREFTPLSLMAIGQRFGGRDHTTVIHAIRVVKKRAIADPYVEVEIEVLRERFAA
jgi:hypothetical protein